VRLISVRQEACFKIVRVADCGEKITALFNFSDNVQTVESDIHSGRELISGKDITVRL
jgi:sucrose phosphorylase